MTTATETTKFYDDGILDVDHPLRVPAERAYRDAYLAAAKQTVWWDEPDIEAIEVAKHARMDARFAAVVGLEKGCYLFASDHVLAAARTRGRHHALEFACQAWEREEAEQHDMPALLRCWLNAVIRWAEGPMDVIVASPHPDVDRPHST